MGSSCGKSVAINLYLAKKHASVLLPKTMEGEAEAIQWSFWVMTEVEKPALTVTLQRFLLPEDKRDSKLADEAEHQLQKPLSVLDQRLMTTGYLIGETFTVADLNVASVLSWPG
jgi:glutathione S-transferase